MFSVRLNTLVFVLFLCGVIKKRMFCWLKQTKNSSSDNEDNRCLCINALQMILKCVADASWSFLILWHTVRQSSPVHLCVSFKWEYEICVFSEVMSEVFTGGERCCHVFRGHKTSRWESLLCSRAIKSRLKIDRSYYADKLKKKQRERERWGEGLMVLKRICSHWLKHQTEMKERTKTTPEECECVLHFTQDTLYIYNMISFTHERSVSFSFSVRCLSSAFTRITSNYQQ